MSVSQAAFDQLKAKFEALEVQLAQVKMENVGFKTEQLQSTSTAGGQIHILKDLTVGNLIKPWRGEASDVAIEDFLSHVDKAASLGNWSERDKVQIISLKLEGAAAAFLSSNEDLQSSTITYSDFRKGLIERFQSRQPDQFHYAQLQTASQAKGETVEAFADRCKKLSLRTIRKVGDARAQEVINEEAERRLIAAFTSGLHGNVGVQVRYRMPTTFAEALNHAATVSAIDRESRPGGTVFAINAPRAICYGCGKPGHFKRDCKFRTWRSRNRFDNRNASNAKHCDEHSKPPTCATCRKVGQLDEQCHNMQRQGKQNHPNARGSTRAPTSNGN